MEKRSILRKIKNQPTYNEAPPQREADVALGDETFEEDIQNKIEVPITHKEPKKKVRKQKEETKEVIVEAPVVEAPIVEVKPKLQNDEKYPHLSEARKKSLETRRRKKEESLRMKIQAEELQKQLQQQKEENAKLRSTPSEPRRQTRPEIDYDILAEKIYGKFSYTENNIREFERKAAHEEYEKRLAEYEKQQHSLRAATGRPQLYTQARSKPNRAFDAVDPSYWGRR